MKDFVVISFSEYYKSAREKLHSKLNEEQNLSEVVESLYLLLTAPDEVDKFAKIMQSDSSNKYVHCCDIENFNLFVPE